MKRQINRIDEENPETDTDAHRNLVYKVVFQISVENQIIHYMVLV